ncbi:hypothetical protein [Devriesea agamarum]|uniref:hypothetical protein n=1 Tax=Devriesea agamarum TaxID=472569 RepID=UPI00071E1257|nr:hypothetical protein [Devriesea agamarum]
MTGNLVVEFVAVLALVGWVIARQFTARPLTHRGPRILVVLAIIGAVQLFSVVQHHTISLYSGIGLLLTAVIAGLLGLARGATMRIWRDADGKAWRQGTIWTLGLWGVSIALHIAISTLLVMTQLASTADESLLRTPSILIYIAITLGAQHYLTYQRLNAHEANRACVPSFLAR